MKTDQRVLDRVLARAKRIKRPMNISLRIGVDDSKGLLRRKRAPDEPVSRTAKENNKILFINKARGRNILYISPADQKKANDLWRDGTLQITKSNAGSAESTLKGRAKQLGKYVIDGYRDRIKNSKGEKGKLRPVKPRTQKQKDREGERPGLPPLYRTGQLQEAFLSSIKNSKL